MNILSSKRILFIFSLMVPFLLHCERDHYSEIMHTGKCETGNPKPSKECLQVLAQTLPIDHQSFIGHEEEKDFMLRGMYVLLTAPIDFEKGKEFLGKASLDDAEMYDFQQTFMESGGANWNQKFFNYVLNQLKGIAYRCERKAPYYNHWGTLTLCPPEDRDTISYFAAVLLHEARHSQTGPHEIACDHEQSGDFWKCDKGLDKPYGWQMVLRWGFLQGDRKRRTRDSSYFDKENLMELSERTTYEWSSIYGIPPKIRPIEQGLSGGKMQL